MTDQIIEKYVRLYHTMLYRVAFCYLRSSADAEDVCQEAFIRLLNYSGEFPSDEDCRRWLIRVAVNLSKNLLKYRRTHGEPVEFPDENAGRSAEPVAESELLPLIRSLPPEYGTVIHLFYYEGYSTREIAQILDISVTAVTSRLSRGRRRLKQLLTEEDQL